jgi:hypothetical protein
MAAVCAVTECLTILSSPPLYQLLAGGKHGTKTLPLVAR